MSQKTDPLEFNPNITLAEALKGEPGFDVREIKTKDAELWAKKNTAMLVVHGIGNQLPLETLDQFGRGLIAEYQALYPGLKLGLEHVIVSKISGNDDVWFDNVVRIRLEGHEHYIDLYEYYWANYTEDKATFMDIQHWLNGVVAGAEKFYKKIAELNVAVGDDGPFFDSHGKFLRWKYNLFLKSVTYLIPIFRGVFKAILWLLSFIPYIGEAIKEYFKDFTNALDHNLSNVIGDIVVYNVSDPKSKYYCVKRKVMDGAVDALTFLIERQQGAEGEESLSYPSVIVAGHSLGTQVSYDAINKLNLLINQQKIKNYDQFGTCTLPLSGTLKIKDQLKGFVTFGSPLDKIAFFLREIVPDESFLRQQLLDDYHGFKQKDWSMRSQALKKPNQKLKFVPLANSLVRYLDDVKWHNYYDDRDYVSGSLEYYGIVTNINCQFNSKWYGFTHSNYWDCSGFYKDIIINFLA
jgi:hypothetical protein